MAKQYRRAWSRNKGNRGGVPIGGTLVWNLDPFWVKHVENKQVRSGSYVYVVGTENAVKIGKTKSPWSRLSELKVGSPDPLELLLLIGCQQYIDRGGVESALHTALRRYRIKGEWFDRSGEGVQVLLNYPGLLPWDTIEGMLRRGIRSAKHRSKLQMQRLEEDVLERAWKSRLKL